MTMTVRWAVMVVALGVPAVARGICGAGILPGDTVAVVGAGYFGQLMAQAVRNLGAWRVVMLDKVLSAIEQVAKHRDQVIKAVIGPKAGPVQQGPARILGNFRGGNSP